MTKTLAILPGQWGWITPGTNADLRHAQREGHLRFMREPITPARQSMMFCHCGWFLDAQLAGWVLRLTSRCPEPKRALRPADRATLAQLRKYVQAGRLHPVAYPYAACVSEATTGEGLLRQLRLSLDLNEQAFGVRPRVVATHDGVYCLDWGATQQPQIANLLGVQAFWATVPGSVQPRAGQPIRLIDHDPLSPLLPYGDPTRTRPHGVILELHTHMDLVHQLERQQWSAMPAGDVQLNWLTVDQYLRAVPPTPIHACDSLGTKSWYGGVLDGLQIEQCAKTIELRLPALEALALQTADTRSPAQQRAALDELAQLWKASFILMDNHLHWQCHNYKAHFLPAARQAQQRMDELEARLLGAEAARKKTRPRMLRVFNPTPWPRLAVWQEGRRTGAMALAGWAVQTADVSAPQVQTARTATADPRDPRVLDNGQVRFTLDRRGQVQSIALGKDAEQPMAWGQLLHIGSAPSQRQFTLAADASHELQGAAAVSVQCDLPARTRTAHLAVDEIVGAAFVAQVEHLGPDGRLLDTTWKSLHSLHWGGPGLPRRRSPLAPVQVEVARGARQLRWTLWLQAEGELRLSPARLWLTTQTGSGALVKSRWQVREQYRNQYLPAAIERLRVLQADPLLKTVRVTGTLAGARLTLDLTLRAGALHLEHDLRLRFTQATDLGLLSPPLDAMAGSLLGAGCERPYVPGLCVLGEVAPGSRYWVDKPYDLVEALQPAARTWHTDQRDWWLGMSPFIGMNVGIAQTPRGQQDHPRQLAWCTRGIKHFFRWRRGSREQLGLSLGATLIHMMTQGHSVGPSHPLHHLIGRNNFNPYEHTPWLRAQGEYRFHYACTATGAQAGAGAAARWALWRQAQEFALPVQFAQRSSTADAAPGIECQPAQVVVTAVEPTAQGCQVRLLNTGSRAATAQVTWLGRTRTVRLQALQIAQLAWPARAS